MPRPHRPRVIASGRAPLLGLWLVTVLPLSAQEPPAADHHLRSGPAPDGFTRFEFPGAEAEAARLSGYLWYHFRHRAGNPLVLFNKEYLTTADLWLAGAREGGNGRLIQEIHREHLLGAEMDDEGYVLTHQHFSHAHDHGWPFPLWTQAGRSPDETEGTAAGWHFQTADHLRGWTAGYLKGWNRPGWFGAAAAEAWELENAESLGVDTDRWRVKGTGSSPALLTPAGVEIDAFNAPFLQLRWKRTPPTGEEAAPRRADPFIEWMREGDEGFSDERRMLFFPQATPLSGEFHHSILPMHTHPLWRGRITRIRISPAPGESDVGLEIDSFFCVYDTRHTINNPILILSSEMLFNWTGDSDFLRRNINRMRIALHHQRTVMGGLEHLRIRNPWPGHDGLAGYIRNDDGTKTFRPGHGIGNNYWDLMPFGWDDLYATNQYHAATLAMARLERAIAQNPGWNIPRGALAFDADSLEAHAAEVRARANELFWNPAAGRFIAAIDADGVRHDYGYTFLNLDSIWYGLASDEHARAIMDWIGGRRIVQGDTSTGADIYHWRFGPRASTLRNIEWYGQGWHGPESLEWGAQIQDGGGVLGFTFYDLHARLRVLGPDDAWRRLTEILAWEEEVAAAGGYRAYYEGGKRGTTLQGGGTAGGIGVDHEFFESSLLPAIAPLGFLGLDARPDELRINPRLPAACPRMTARDLLYRGVRMDVTAAPDLIEIELKSDPLTTLAIRPPEGWSEEGRTGTGVSVRADRAGKLVFTR